MRTTYTPPKIDFTAQVRKSKTVPSQSMSIQEIVRKYVKGIPVDVQQRNGVYVDQNEVDLEKLSRADFGEKADYAAEMKQRQEEYIASVEEQKMRLAEAEATKKREEDERRANAASAKDKGEKPVA